MSKMLIRLLLREALFWLQQRVLVGTPLSEGMQVHFHEPPRTHIRDELVDLRAYFVDDEVQEGAEKCVIGCPPGIRTPICRSRGGCPTIERGGNKTQIRDSSCAGLATATAGRRAQNQPFHHKGNLLLGQTGDANFDSAWQGRGRAASRFPCRCPCPIGFCQH